MIGEVHQLAARICESHQLKPYIHHLHHVVDEILWLGKLMSCFVCERKHRSVKDTALHVFRHIEHTVLADVLNKQAQQMANGDHLSEETFLVAPRSIDGAPANMLRSRGAVLRCGEVRVGDVVGLHGGVCGRVNMFYKAGQSILFVD